MNELLFPLGTLLLVMLVIIPFLSLCAQARIGYLQLKHPSFDRLHTGRLLFWLCLSTMLPLTWIVLSTSHLLSSDWLHASHASICLLNHHHFWTDEAILLTLTFLLVLGMGCKMYWDDKAYSWTPVSDEAQSLRIHRLCSAGQIGNPKRVWLVESTIAAQSVGVFNPRILLSRDWLLQIDDDMLKATLLHEFAHLHAGDLWTGGLLKLGMKINLAARRLQPSTLIWMQSRELAADRTAVEQGADPLALAEAIVNALRWQRRLALQAPPSSQLSWNISSEYSIALVKLRLSKLTDNSLSHQPQSSPLVDFGILAVLLALCTPHLLSIDLLDALHLSIELLAQEWGMIP